MRTPTLAVPSLECVIISRHPKQNSSLRKILFDGTAFHGKRCKLIYQMGLQCSKKPSALCSTISCPPRKSSRVFQLHSLHTTHGHTICSGGIFSPDTKRFSRLRTPS